MRVLEIWLYPVKSLRGAQLDRAEIGSEGVEGNRRYAIFDLATGFGLTANDHRRRAAAARPARIFGLLGRRRGVVNS